MGRIKDFDKWIGELKGKEGGLNLWREAMAQLRQLHGDVWNGVRFFLTVNGIIIAAMFAVIVRCLTSDNSGKAYILGSMIVFVAFAGLFLTIIAVRILKKHRAYYLEMLLVKTLLEKELGFYDVDYQGISLSFPWKVDKKYTNGELERPDKWMTEQIWRKGTISRLLCLTYWSFIVLYGAIIIGTMMWIICQLVR